MKFKRIVSKLFVLAIFGAIFSNGFASSSPSGFASSSEDDCWEWGTYQVRAGIAVCDDDSYNCTHPCLPDDDDE